MSDVFLKVDGAIHSGWKEIKLSFSLESIANTFELTLTDKWSESSEARAVTMGSQCEVWIDKTKVLTGYIDDVYPQYDANQHIVIVSGRSKAGDLVDSTHAGNTFKNRNLKQLATELCTPFGINVFVSDGVDIGKPFKTIEIQTGETIFEFLEQAARIRALRIVSNVDGDIVITQASNNRISTPLMLGGNIKSASGEFTRRDSFSEITVVGSQESDDNNWGSASAHIKGQYSDSFFTKLKRHRPMILTADGNVTLEDCKKRAQWEVNTRHGRSQGIVYTVNGWLHKEGLWEINYLVPVDDKFMVINDERLIVDVQLLMDEGGERSELRVMPPEAFKLVKLPEPDADEEQGWAKIK